METRPGKNPRTGKEQGELLTGGKPGNKGGGRRPAELREKLRMGLDAVLSQVQWDAVLGDIDRQLKCIDVLARYGIGTKQEIEVVSPEHLKRIIEVTADLMDATTFAKWLSLLEKELDSASG